MNRNIHRTLAGTLGAVIIVSTLAGCAGPGGGTSSPSASAADLDAALAKGGSVTYWTWDPNAKLVIDALQKEYPKVDVTLVTIDQATLYTKLSNVLTAGTGAPDITTIDYQTLPQYVYGEGLLNLSSLGLDDLETDYVESVWSSVNIGDELYALPGDYAPMSLYYNKTVFDQFGLIEPTTWDEYVADAKKLHAADSSRYITTQSVNGPFATSMIWAAGGHPFTVDGDTITVDLQDEGTLKWTSTWNQLVEDGLLSPTPEYTDDWYKQIANGQIVSLVSAAWIPNVLQGLVPELSGDWRAAPMPTHDGVASSAEFGGTGYTVLKTTKDPVLAAAVIKYFSQGEGAMDAVVAAGSFPSTLSALESPTFADATSEYFGGQKVNQVALDSAKTIPTGWEYLPFQNYANQIFVDSVGQSFANGTDLNEGLKKWQQDIIDYGNQQGFKMTEK